jgi:hypothetical protein
MRRQTWVRAPMGPTFCRKRLESVALAAWEDGARAAGAWGRRRRLRGSEQVAWNDQAEGARRMQRKPTWEVEVSTGSGYRAAGR